MRCARPPIRRSRRSSSALRGSSSRTRRVGSPSSRRGRHRAAAGARVRGAQADGRHHVPDSVKVSGPNGAGFLNSVAAALTRAPVTRRTSRCSVCSSWVPPAPSSPPAVAAVTADCAINGTARGGDLRYVGAASTAPLEGPAHPRTPCSLRHRDVDELGQHRREHGAVRRHRRERRRHPRLRDVRVPGPGHRPALVADRRLNTR